jgi:outer membrane protein
MKHIGAILFLTATALTAVAQTNTAPTNAVRTMTLDQCITEALKHNFDVQVERFSPEISEENLYASYGGWDPTLNVSGTHHYGVSGGGLDANQLQIPPTVTDENNFSADVGSTLPEGLQYDFFGNLGQSYGHYSPTNTFENASGSIGVNLKQPLLKNFWIDSTREAIYVAKNRYKYSEQGLRLQLITTLALVENAYYEVVYAYANVTVEQEALNLATQQLSDDQTRVRIQVLAEHGGTIEQDEAQVAQSRANLITAQYTLEKNQNTLKNLITDKYTDWHDVDIMPADKMDAVRQLFDVQDSWDKGLRLRPDLQQAKLNAEQQGIVLKYDRNQLYPELDLVGSYGFNGSSAQYSGTLGEIRTGNEPMYSYGGQLTVPLSNISARNNYKANKAQEAQMLLQLKQLEQNIMVTIDDDVKNAEAAWESVDATRDQRIYAEVALQAEQQKYAVGTSTTFVVLQLQNNLTAARSQEIRTLANYNEALVTLGQDEGSILQMRNIDIEVK